jgi:hypothetical protein
MLRPMVMAQGQRCPFENCSVKSFSFCTTVGTWFLNACVTQRGADQGPLALHYLVAGSICVRVGVKRRHDDK